MTQWLTDVSVQSRRKPRCCLLLGPSVPGPASRVLLLLSHLGSEQRRGSWPPWDGTETAPPGHLSAPSPGWALHTEGLPIPLLPRRARCSMYHQGDHWDSGHRALDSGAGGAGVGGQGWVSPAQGEVAVQVQGCYMPVFTPAPGTSVKGLSFLGGRRGSGVGTRMGSVPRSCSQNGHSSVGSSASLVLGAGNQADIRGSEDTCPVGVTGPEGSGLQAVAVTPPVAVPGAPSSCSGTRAGFKLDSGCSCLEIPWTEEPGGLQSMGSHRVRHDGAD